MGAIPPLIWNASLVYEKKILSFTIIQNSDSDTPRPTFYT